MTGDGSCCGSDDGVGTAATFLFPRGIAIDPVRAAYALVADEGNHLVRKIDLATREVMTLAGMAGEEATRDGAGSAARFVHPNGVAVHRSGRYALVATGNHALRRVALDA